MHCDMEEKATCVLPRPAISEEYSYVGTGRGIKWLGDDINPGFEFTYKADSNQMGFLQLLSSRASQELTYHCKNSIAVFDARKRSFRNALRIMTSTDQELKARGNNKFRYRVLEDGCKTRSDTWSLTKILYRTEKPLRLPFADIGLQDVGTADKLFKIELGPVCYS